MVAIEKIQTGINENISKAESAKTQLSQVIELLKKRQALIQDKLSKQQVSAARTISDQLWVIILVIGFSGIVTMLVVLFFPHPIQMEWVASGQVIQFVTVLILLSVILSLGLSDILRENVLGTLLGGIAGYVLAQGVGRAAARAALTSGAALPPPPPPVAAPPPVAPPPAAP